MGKEKAEKEEQDEALHESQFPVVCINCCAGVNFYSITRMNSGTKRRGACDGITEPDRKHDQLTATEQHQLQCRSGKRDSERDEHSASNTDRLGCKLKSGYPHHIPGGYPQKGAMPHQVQGRGGPAILPIFPLVIDKLLAL
jgi:hypothetical protein